ncbi:hypothetical protein [Sphingobium yanoikuyae]|uniref:hypothetical protein n=1 Tax=Sphingobium yanoikuyae TaxID=13690 RepID=UPI0013CEEF6E|nr:hypothetical protein [Sphingobium yanoikuyae]
MLEVGWHNARWSAFSKTLESLSDVLRQANGQDEDPDIAWHRMKAWAASNGQIIDED